MVDETAILLEANCIRNSSGKYSKALTSFFQNELTDGKTLYTDTISAE